MDKKQKNLQRRFLCNNASVIKLFGSQVPTQEVNTQGISVPMWQFQLHYIKPTGNVKELGGGIRYKKQDVKQNRKQNLYLYRRK